MKVRRKSLWRSENAKHAINKKFANMRAAKERKRMARAFADVPMPDTSHVLEIKPAKPLFVVTIRCRDGETVKLRIHDGPHGLTMSPTMAGRKVAAVLANYRPAHQIPT